MIRLLDLSGISYTKKPIVDKVEIHVTSTQVREIWYIFMLSYYLSLCENWLTHLAPPTQIAIWGQHF